MRLARLCNSVRSFSTDTLTPKVCIVGAGPAGFYAAQQLLKSSGSVNVDVLERLPVPFGLVRFGVAPDHPEVKNVINTFHKTATNPRFRFLGNVDVGRDVSVEELRQIYHAVLLTYGAEEDRVLGIPGEDLDNVISGRRFVGWYNGVPGDSGLRIDLDTEEAVILGQGNVAIDIARILLSPVDKLKSTDITSYALEKLSGSRVRKVWLVGRRGPLEAAFTIAELREILKLDGCRTTWRPDDFVGVKDTVPTLARPRKRLTELMLKHLEEGPGSGPATKELLPVFLRGPVQFLGSGGRVTGVRLSVNRLKADDQGAPVAVATGTFEELPCGLAFRSIGYRSVQIDEAVPFDPRSGRVRNTLGKVEGNLYTAGWAATGPVGVILSTMTNAFEVGRLIHKDLGTVSEGRPGREELGAVLRRKGVQVVSYQDWERIDRVECERGKRLGKPREKIVDVKEMLEIASR